MILIINRVRFLNKDRALFHKMGLLEMNELEALGIDSCGGVRRIPYRRR